MSEKPTPSTSAAGSSSTDLEQVNERLRKLITSLRGEQERREARSMTPIPGRTPVPGRTPIPAAVPREPDRHLSAELEDVREALGEARAERDRLKARLEVVQADHRRISDEYVAAQEQNTEMARLYVALDRLHRAPTREEAFAAIQEVVINLVGSEEFGVYERRGDVLQLVHGFGLDRTRWREVPVGRGAVGGAAARGDLYVAGRAGVPAPEDRDVSAAIPLRVGERVTGVIAVFRLLGHKSLLDEHDRAVFDLLAAHAGLALHFRADGAAGKRA